MSSDKDIMLVFDCDGTLVDSAGLIVASMHTAFDELGLAQPEDHAVRSIVGLSLTGAIGRLVEGMGLDIDFDGVQTIGEKYKQAFNRLKIDPAYDQPLYPNMRECLELAQARGMVLTIATGKSRKGLESVLERHDLHGYFAGGVTADDAQSKPHPDMLHQLMMAHGTLPENTVMIGDTSFDMEMAVAADCVPVGVEWGNHDQSLLVEAGAKTVLQDARHLLPWLHDNGIVG